MITLLEERANGFLWAKQADKKTHRYGCKHPGTDAFSAQLFVGHNSIYIIMKKESMNTLLAHFVPKPIKTSIKRFLLSNTLVMSQAGQDFWVYGEAFNEMRNGYFLDIGAFDGVRMSNTFILERRYDWNGICIEANPDYFLELKNNRKAKCINACLYSGRNTVDFAKRAALSGIVLTTTANQFEENSEIVKINTVGLDRLLIEENVPSEIDYLSIDIEGAEENVLDSGIFRKYLFRCITIERPTKILRKKLKDAGYTLIKEIPDLDCFYVHQSFLQQYNTNLFDFYLKKHLSIRWL